MRVEAMRTGFAGGFLDALGVTIVPFVDPRVDVYG